VAFAFLGLLALYLLGAALEAPDGQGEVGQPVFWLGRWRMFTDLRDKHEDIEVIAISGDREQALELASLYPSAWDEGPGYLREDFYARPERRAAWVRSLCARSRASALELWLLRWPRRPGQPAIPAEGIERELLWSGPCP
jgi:hypothetical protein